MFTVITFVGFTIFVAVVAWLKTRDDKLDTQEGYFLAGRGLTGLVIAGSLELTKPCLKNKYCTNDKQV